jgi:hypothetical protein
MTKAKGALALLLCSALCTAALAQSDFLTVNGKFIITGSPVNNSLGGAVTMTTQNTYYDGPTVAQGSTGTWFASGNATVAGVAANNLILCKLWDGTTVIDSATLQPSNGLSVTLHLSGYLATPAGNLRIR